MRPLLLFAVAGVVVAAWMGASQPGVAQEAPDRPGLSVSHAGLTARASLGSFCADGLCADALHPPQPKGRLPVRSRARLTLRFTRDATTVEAGLGRRGTRVLVRAEGHGAEMEGPPAAQAPRSEDRRRVRERRRLGRQLLGRDPRGLPLSQRSTASSPPLAQFSWPTSWMNTCTCSGLTP